MALYEDSWIETLGKYMNNTMRVYAYTYDSCTSPTAAVIPKAVVMKSLNTRKSAFFWCLSTKNMSVDDTKGVFKYYYIF